MAREAPLFKWRSNVSPPLYWCVFLYYHAASCRFVLYLALVCRMWGRVSAHCGLAGDHAGGRRRAGMEGKFQRGQPDMAAGHVRFCPASASGGWPATDSASTVSGLPRGRTGRAGHGTSLYRGMSRLSRSGQTGRDRKDAVQCCNWTNGTRRRRSSCPRNGTKGFVPVMGGVRAGQPATSSLRAGRSGGGPPAIRRSG